MKIYSLKTVPLPAHHAERDGYFGRAILAFLLLCCTPLQCLLADEVPNDKRPQQPPIQSEEVSAARSPDIEAMRADLNELRRTAYDPRDKAILDLEKKIAAAEEKLVGPPKDATKPTEHLVRIISDPGFGELHRGLLKRDEKASLVVEFHGEQAGAVGLAMPVRIVDIAYGVRATEYTLAVNDSQVVAIQQAYAMSPYWFTLWPFKDDHAEKFAQAESLADVLKAHPEWSPNSEEQWGYGAVRESGRAQPPERASLPTNIVVTADSSATDEKGESPWNVPADFAPDRSPLLERRRSPPNATAAGLRDPLDPHPFDGEWKFHALASNGEKQMTAAEMVRAEFADTTAEVAEGFKIRDRRLLLFGSELPYELTEASGGWDMKLIGPDSEATGTVAVFGSILRLSYTEESERTVIEFWRVDPKRKELVRELTSRHEDAASLQQQGRFSELQTVNAQIQQLNRDLKRMDRMPELSSRRAEALRARKTGDHETADKLDAATDSWIQQTDDNAISHEASTEELATQNISATDRATLQRRLDELRVEVERNEDACITAAAAFRDVLTKTEAETNTGRKKELHATLQKAVRTAFENRWQLQDARLKLTAADLETLQEKHQHRKSLAGKIIERRVEQLKNDDELSWTQAATTSTAEREVSGSPHLPTPEGGVRFPTVQVAATEISARLKARDFDGFVNLLPDNVVNDIAGRLAGMAQIYDVSGQAGMPVPAGFDLLILKLEESKLPDPPSIADSALKRLAPKRESILLSSMSIKKQLDDPARQELEAKAAGVLRDPRSFLVSLFEQFEHTFLKTRLKSYDSAMWDFEISANTAVATNTKAEKASARWAFSQSAQGWTIDGLVGFGADPLPETDISSMPLALTVVEKPTENLVGQWVTLRFQLTNHAKVIWPGGTLLVEIPEGLEHHDVSPSGERVVDATVKALLPGKQQKLALVIRTNTEGRYHLTARVKTLGETVAETHINLLAVKELRDETLWKAEPLRLTFGQLDPLDDTSRKLSGPDRAAVVKAKLAYLNGQRVQIRGFMYPTFLAEGLTGFVLIRDARVMDLGADIPGIQMINVKLRYGETTEYRNKPFDVEGVLSIEPQFEDGKILQLYKIEDGIVQDD